jgi:acetoin utilization deacetylase AcuC-like enzyme
VVCVYLCVCVCLYLCLRVIIQAAHACLSCRTPVQSTKPPSILPTPTHRARCPCGRPGFCFFNNVSVAAAAALRHPGIERVLILDWDVHHGNGTESIWLNDERVLVVSLHRRDPNFYPIVRALS